MISLKKSGVIQPVAVVKSLLKIIANLKNETIKNGKNTVAKILTLLTELFSMSPNTPNQILYISFLITISIPKVQ